MTILVADGSAVQHRSLGRSTWQRREPHEIADELIQKSIQAERTLLAAGFRDPIGMNDAAYVAGLRGEHFINEWHSAAFMHFCLCAENGCVPTIDDLVLASRGHCEVEMQGADMLFLLTTDTQPDAMTLFVETVRDFYEKRVETQQCLKRIAELGAGDEYVILVRPKDWRIAPTSACANPSTDKLFVPAKLRSALRRKSRVVTL